MKLLYGVEIYPGKNFLECIPIKSHREQIKKNLDLTLLTGHTIVEPLFHAKEFSSERFFEITQSPIRNSGDEITGILVIARDITESYNANKIILRQKEEFRTILNSVPAIIVLCDGEGKYLAINKTAAKYMGKSPDEIIEKTLFDFFPRKIADLFMEKVRKVIETGEPILNSAGKYPVPTGQSIYTQTDILPCFDADDNIIGAITVVNDVTERQRNLDHLRNISRLYAFLSEINQAVIRNTNTNDLFHSLCYIAVKTGGFRLAWIGLKDNKTVHILPAASYGDNDGYLELFTSAVQSSKTFPISQATSIEEGMVTVINDIQQDIRMLPWRDETLKRGYMSLASIPLKPKGKFIGNFVMYSDKAEFFEYKEIKLLEQIGVDISYGLEKIQVENEREQTEKELQLLATLLNNATNGIIVFNQNRKIIYTNETNLQLYGYSRDEFMKLDFEKLIVPECADNEKQINNILNRKGFTSFRTEHYRKDGSIIPLEVNARKLETEGDEYVIAIASDISAKKKSEEQLQFRSEILNAVMDDIFVWDINNKCVFANVAACKSSGYTSEELVGKNLKEVISPAAYKQIMKGIDQQLLQTGEVIFEIEQIKKDKTKTLGEVHSRIIKMGNQKFKVSVCRDIMERKSYEEKLKNSHTQITRTLNGITQAIAATVELRDPYTAGHQLRVARLARAISKEMKLGDERVRQIYTAALIHDIGKMSLPAEILSKPGKLNEIEYSLIRTHPEAGYNILKNIDFIYPLSQWIREHHERMDGSGYPRGLKDEQISLEARILAVSDVVEAMSSHRPYRPSLGMEYTLEEIAANKGILYDSQVVEVCIKLINEKGFKFE